MNLTPSPILTYLRAGRRKRSTGHLVTTGTREAKGMFKVLPTHPGWKHIWITQPEIDAAAEKRPLVPRKPADGTDSHETPAKPKREAKPRKRKPASGNDGLPELPIAGPGPQESPTIDLSPAADQMRLQWLLTNVATDFECVENIAGNIERYYVPATREGIDLEMKHSTKTP